MKLKNYVKDTVNKLNLKNILGRKILLIVMVIVATLSIVVLNVSSSISPDFVQEELEQDECFTVTKTVEIPILPPKADVVFAFDLTGSMSDIIDTAKTASSQIMDELDATGIDFTYGVMSYMDYPDTYSSCGYFSTYGISSTGDYAYHLDQSLTNDSTAVTTTINSFSLGSGGDGPQDYTRIFYESYADPSVGWREGAKKLLVNFADNVPHDCNLNEGITSEIWSTGNDPGRDEIMGTSDDLDLQSVLSAMEMNGIILLECHKNASVYWDYWTNITGGSVKIVNTADFVEDVVDTITEGLSDPKIYDLHLKVTTPGYSSWLSSVIPPSYPEVQPETNVTFEETICVPDGTSPGIYTFVVSAVDENGISYGDQTNEITVLMNDPPVVSDIPNQTIDEGESFVTIDLDVFVVDPDDLDSEMTWTVSGEVDLSVVIDGDRVATVSVPDVDWFGSEIITFRATDPGNLWDEDSAVFKVNAVNDGPVVGDIPDQTIFEGGSFVSISLDDYVSDVEDDDADISWSYSGNTDLNVSIVARVATISILDVDWNGEETITFTAEDTGGLTGSDDATFTIIDVNDPPVANDDSANTKEDTSIWIDVLANDGDIDGTLDPSTVTITSGPSHGSTTVNTTTGEIQYIPDPNYYTQDTFDSFTYTVQDNDAATSNTTTVRITVDRVNDAPAVGDIPDQTIFEGGSFVSISLDDYVSDVEDDDADISWSYSGNTDLNVSIVARVATISILDVDWNGEETITFTAEDTGGLTGSDDATFNVTAVNDAPVVGDIPNQTIDEGESFVTIDLDVFVVDPDDLDSEMTWTVSGEVDLSVVIDGDRVATVSVPDVDWFGSEIITFRATDPGNLWDEDSATFMVNAVNDGPVVGDIPDQFIAEGGVFVDISLDDFVDDVDNLDVEMTWSFSGNVDLDVSIVGRVASVSVPGVDWSGEEVVTFRAMDLGGLWDEDSAVFNVSSVNDAPVVGDIPNQTIDEGESFVTIDLDVFVVDPDDLDSEMTWTVSGEVDLSVVIDGDRVATVSVPDVDWFGSEIITFRATDPGNLWDEDSATFMVNAVNDGPVVGDIPDQFIAEGGVFVDISLDDFVDDVDNLDVEMTWSFSGNVDLDVSIVGRVASVSVPGVDWSGEEVVTFRAMDLGGLWDEDSAVFNVSSVNDAPVVGDIPNQTIDEGESFVTIDLDVFVVDPDDLDSEMTWTVSGEVDLSVVIDGDRVATVSVPDVDWFGSEIITFRATDPGNLWDEDSATFMVNAVNDGPVVGDIPDQFIAEGGVFVDISLDDFVDDVDNLDVEMTWSFSGNVDLDVSIVGRVASVSVPGVDWSGEEVVTFRAMDLGGLWDEDSAVFNVSSVNDAPVVGDIPNQTIDEGESFVTIDLDVFVVDPDDLDSEMTWTVSGEVDLSVVIDGDRVATVSVPDVDWFGSEIITFRATDPGNLWDEDSATFMVNAVNDGPVVGDIPDQFIAEGGVFVDISLDDFVDDVDNLDVEMTWSFSGNVDLDVSIVGRVASVSVPGVDWSGEEVVTFRAMDLGGLWDEDSAVFNVSSVNDAPVVGDIPNQTIDEGESFVTIDLDVFVVDPDDLDSEMTWTVSGEVDLSVVIDGDRVATVSVPDVDWFGSEIITFRATDPGNLWDEDSATFMVNAVNDGPVVGDIPDQFIAEGGVFVDISLDDFVDDVDNLDVEMTWSFSGNVDLDVSIVGRVASVSVPGVDWSGEEVVTFRAMDLGGLWDEDSAVFNVSSVNDPPNAPINPDPSDGETDVILKPKLSVYVSDPDGNTLDVSFYNAADDSLIGTDLGVPNGSYASVTWSGRSYGTTYRWYAIANDSFLENTSETWSFETESKPSSGPGPRDQEPLADAGGPYMGLVGEEIEFDGSGSSDSDGDIEGYRWDFDNDGTCDTEWLTNSTVNHSYDTAGDYKVKLEVIDDDDATDTDTATVTITQLNNPPTKPAIEGQKSGTQNTSYNYTISSTDPDNDTIQYHIDWNDGTSTASSYLSNGTIFNVTHLWTSPGIFKIQGYATDEYDATSGTTEFIVLIDVHYCKNIGYLIDSNSNGIYDLFYSNKTGNETVPIIENGTYLIDNDGDGKRDYAYNLETGLLTFPDFVYLKFLTLYENTSKTPGFEVISLLAMIAIALIILRRRKKIDR